MKSGSKYIIFVLLCFIVWACKTTSHYTTRPSASLNNSDNDVLELNLVAQHINDSVTTTFIEIGNENLLYRRPDTTLAFFAELKISYRLLPEPDSKKILDSGSFYLRDRMEGEAIKLKSLLSKYDLRAKTGNNYYLEVEAFDLNRRTKYNSGINIYKQDSDSEQNFLVMRHDSVVFKNNFFKDDKISIRTSNLSLKQVTVECFFKEFGPAPPPFAIRQEKNEEPDKPDSSFYLSLNDGTLDIIMPAKGAYHVKANTKSNGGVTLYTFDNTFPGVSNTDEMIACTRYIMNREEYEACKDAAEKKAAIDKFWLTIAGSNERARELIKRYYGRVKEANKYFTSYLQGWKSDRGMIFIVFGQPVNVYKSKRDEIWVYGNEVNQNVLRFEFNKKENSLSDNDYVLERSVFYRDAYYMAVDYWRDGNIYSESRR